MRTGGRGERKRSRRRFDYTGKRQTERRGGAAEGRKKDYGTITINRGEYRRVSAFRLKNGGLTTGSRLYGVIFRITRARAARPRSLVQRRHNARALETSVKQREIEFCGIAPRLPAQNPHQIPSSSAIERAATRSQRYTRPKTSARARSVYLSPIDLIRGTVGRARYQSSPLSLDLPEIRSADIPQIQTAMELSGQCAPSIPRASVRCISRGGKIVDRWTQRARARAQTTTHAPEVCANNVLYAVHDTRVSADKSGDGSARARGETAAIFCHSPSLSLSLFRAHFRFERATRRLFSSSSCSRRRVVILHFRIITMVACVRSK